MPISLIPQQQPSRRPLGESFKAWTGGDFFVSVSLFILIIAIAAYVGLTAYQAHLNDKLQKDNAAYTALQQSKSVRDQTQAAHFAERSQDIKQLLQSHVNLLPLFALLENYTHAKVTWTNLDFDASKGDLKLQGVAGGYQSVAEQMALLQKNSAVQHVSVSGFLLGNDGLLHFSADVQASSQAFLPASQ